MRGKKNNLNLSLMWTVDRISHHEEAVATVLGVRGILSHQSFFTRGVSFTASPYLSEPPTPLRRPSKSSYNHHIITVLQ